MKRILKGKGKRKRKGKKLLKDIKDKSDKKPCHCFCKSVMFNNSIKKTYLKKKKKYFFKSIARTTAARSD